MKGIYKFLSSRFFTAGVCILLQFGQLITVYVLLYEYSLVMMLLSYIFDFCVLLYVINRVETPEFKLPWVIIILLLPIVGAFIFILFSGTNQSKKELHKYEKATKELLPYQVQTAVIETLKEQDMDAYLQANYIYRATGMPCYDTSKITYYPIGEAYFAALTEALQAAKHFIFLEYFIVEKGVMWDTMHNILTRKVKQGVKVNIMYDDFGCMTTLPGHYYKELTKEGINCIPSNKLRPILSQMPNNRDHRKIAVIDGTVGFTGGINLADEYINEIVKHGHWKDTGVKIEGEAVKSLTMLFLTLWNTWSPSKLDCSTYMEIQPKAYKSDGIVIPYGDGPEPFYKDSIGKMVYLNMINNAKNYVYIMTPYLICDYEMINALRTAAKKGVDVRIITPHIPDKKMVFIMTRSHYEPLIRDGVKIYEYTPGFVHAKSFVCDDKLAICGTINLDYRSLVHHFECGVWMYGADCIVNMKTDFLETMMNSEYISIEKAVLTVPQRLIRNVMKVFSPLL